MQIEYEEKTFENYFNAALDKKDIFFFPPGQVQEGSLGADSIADMQSRKLWKQLGFTDFSNTPLAGLPLAAMAQEMEKYLGQKIKNIPSIQGNILFQFKRSQRMIHSNAEEWHHWSEPYFRYEIYPKQHTLLAQLHLKFSADVLILYAAPAIVSMDDLVQAHIDGKIISKTNFRPAHQLTKHKRNTFVKPGNHSVACSEPSRLESFDLETEARSLRAKVLDPQAALVEFASVVTSVLRRTSYRRSFDLLMNYYGFQSLAEAPLVGAYLQMAVVRELTSIQWVIVGDPVKTPTGQEGVVKRNR